MQDRHGDAGSSKARRALQPLAPRDSRPSPSARERTSTTATTGRPPRLSHRSRAGCWTCRGRKVKCDEAHPRCGPCTRLNRDCDWDHRWNFSDATTSTQGKYSNINTSGNAVWDPSVRHDSGLSPVLDAQDDLPEFAVLTNDEDRERKAVMQRPGTYGVVVTPESFHDLPEYAAAAASSPFGSRRTSTNSSRGGHGSPRSGITRASTLPALTDENTIILDKFEEVSPTAATNVAPFTISESESRRSSYPEDGLQRLSISTAAYSSSLASAPLTPASQPEDYLIRHFRQYIVPRLCQPQQDSNAGAILQTTAEVLESEATRFPPLHHAMCAVSALNLSNNGRATLEDAMQHYEKALSASAAATTPHDLLSDGVFFRHLLLFVYDICIPTEAGDDDTNMWAGHLTHLRLLAMQRHQLRNHAPYAYALWTICQLDMYACLMGSGGCEFVETITRNNMLPPLEHQIPPQALVMSPGAGPFHPHEMQIFPPVLRLNEGIVLRAAKLAQTAHNFRQEVKGPGPIPPGTYAQWQAATASLQNDLHTFWQQAYPVNLGHDTIAASNALPERVRAVFDNAVLLYHAATIYSRTSMFRGQRQIPIASQYDINTDTDNRAQAILHVASQQIENRKVASRQSVFPIFMAGFAAKNPDVKLHAIELIKAFEGYGIGSNTYRTRQLLVAVCEEQRRLASIGGRMEDVEWLVIAKERGLSVVNCGL
ncbi:C6 finger domain transcription factor nosA [Pseudocercospora fuligena]|uniref:C6 finger domain transcription factor nosA n=1 Tax=Pseudocercospora fuligena TaxID=685502 RepID=A0A8H6RCC4_9PEZI|nr:C6 finger domain transcription factor nosA [Pseudocercospora fuligena]